VSRLSSRRQSCRRSEARERGTAGRSAENGRVRGVGCPVVGGGVLLSGLGALVWFANGLAMEAASREGSLVGHVGMIAGAVVAVAGSVMAVLGKREG
jgi:hypothetical protein